MRKKWRIYGDVGDGVKQSPYSAVQGNSVAKIFRSVDFRRCHLFANEVQSITNWNSSSARQTKLCRQLKPQRTWIAMELVENLVHQFRA